jgi:hypothetical protein
MMTAVARVMSILGSKPPILGLISMLNLSLRVDRQYRGDGGIDKRKEAVHGRMTQGMGISMQ